MNDLISSRTPEGRQFECPHCGLFDRIEPSILAGDACCPACGHLLWFAIERDSPGPPGKPRRPKKAKGRRRRNAAGAGEPSREFAEFEEWLHREMAGSLTAAQIFGILRRVTEVLEQERWGRSRRVEFFAGLREALRNNADRPIRWRRPRRGLLRTIFRLITGLVQGRLRDQEGIRYAVAPGHDPLFDPWLDAG